MASNDQCTSTLSEKGSYSLHLCIRACHSNCKRIVIVPTKKRTPQTYVIISEDNNEATNANQIDQEVTAEPNNEVTNANLIDQEVPSEPNDEVTNANLIDQEVTAVYSTGTRTRNVPIREPESNNEGQRRPKKRRKVENSLQSSSVPQPMPADLKAYIEQKGVDIANVKLLIAKEVSETDLNKHNGRFNIPYNQVNKNNDFLTPQEKENLYVGEMKGQRYWYPNGKPKDIRKDEEISSKRKPFNIKLIEPCLEETEVKFNVWDYTNTSCYVLTSGWTTVFNKSQNKTALRVNQSVQIWTFRLNGRLYFAMNGIEDDNSSNSACGNERVCGEINSDTGATI